MENHQQEYQHRRVQKKKKKKRAYFIYFLLAYIGIIAPFIYASIRGEEYHNAYWDRAKALVGSFGKPTESVAVVEESTEITTAAVQEESTTVEETERASVQETAAEEVTLEEEDTQAESVTTEAEAFVQVDESYFDDALFIGDSRTVGIKEYSFIKNADFFADNSMTSFAILEKELEVGGVGKTTLPNLLTTKTYKKIYIMLGINELGYPYNSVIKKYGEVLKTVREYQPQAIIFVEANLHVTKKRSDTDALYNNANINKLNEGMKALSDTMENAYYIDINELFDDESGSLRADYAGDSAHVYGRYYNDWAKWLCTKGIL